MQNATPARSSVPEDLINDEYAELRARAQVTPAKLEFLKTEHLSAQMGLRCLERKHYYDGNKQGQMGLDSQQFNCSALLIDRGSDFRMNCKLLFHGMSDSNRCLTFLIVLKLDDC